MPVSFPSPSTTGRTVRLWRSVRRAISCASSSIETPALMRRTLDWLSTSLLNGISRDWLSVIFWTDFAIEVTPRRPIQSLSLDLQARHEAKRRPLALEGGAEAATRQLRTD